MPAGIYRIRVQIDNRLLRRQFKEIVSKNSDFFLLEDKDTQRTNLLILELDENPDHTFELVQTLLNNDEADEIFLASESTDQNVLIKAMRSGAREFFGPYTEEKEVLDALERFAARQSKARARETPTRSSQTIAVMGSKGGVGTTTTAVNLATSLASRNNKKSVALMDLNLFGDIPLFLDIDPSYSWREITKNISRLDSTFLKNILAVDPSGVYVLPSPSYLDTHNMATPEMIERLFKVMSAMFDFVIVDAGQLFNDTALKILELSDKVFLVAVQSLPCLAKTNKILGTFRELGYPPPNKVHIVLNRFVKKANIDIEDVEKSLEKEIYWCLPNDYLTTISAINKGQPLTKIAPKQEITQSFWEQADMLVEPSEEGEKKKKKKGWLFFR